MKDSNFGANRTKTYVCDRDYVMDLNERSYWTLQTM